MRVLLLDPDPKWLEERRRLGHDRFDEVWDGVLHVVSLAVAPRLALHLSRVDGPKLRICGADGSAEI